MMDLRFALAFCVATAWGHGDHQKVIQEGPHKALWYNTLPGDGGTQVRHGHSVAVSLA
jgi:agmatinase